MQCGLSHKNPRVPILVLKQLQRCARDDDLSQILGQHPIYHRSLQLMKEDLSVAAEVAAFLLQLTEHKLGLDLFVGNETVSCLQEQMTENETVALRVLELAVKVSQTSQDHLDRLDDAGLLKPLLKLVDVEDVLVRLNAIELFTGIALTHQGLRFLEANEVLTKMETILKNSRNGQFSEILMPGLIKFFGNIAHLRPKQMIITHPIFVDSLFIMTESTDLVQKVVAFETIGYIGISLEGKSSLADIGNKMTDSIEKLETLIQDSPTEIRIRAMNAFASLIKLDKENQTERFLCITEAWFRHALGARPMYNLVNILKQPFQELRQAVYLIFSNMAQQEWGRCVILRHPGLPELLLDRSFEHLKEGKDAKFELIKTLTESGDLKTIVGEEIEQHLKEYVAEGAYNVQAEVQVAYLGEH